jgi:hypothetical protein
MLVIISICLTVHLFGLEEILGGGQYGFTMVRVFEYLTTGILNAKLLITSPY